METLPPDIRDHIHSDYGAVRETLKHGVSPSYARKANSQWTVWLCFCASIQLDPHLQNITNPIPFLQIYAHRVCTGELATNGLQIKKRSVEQYLRSVGQKLAGLGAKDPVWTRPENMISDSV